MRFAAFLGLCLLSCSAWAAPAEFSKGISATSVTLAGGTGNGLSINGGNVTLKENAGYGLLDSVGNMLIKANGGHVGIGNGNSVWVGSGNTDVAGSALLGVNGQVSATGFLGSGVGLTNLPVYESVSLTTSGTRSDNFVVTGMTSATQVTTEARITPTSSTVIAGIAASGVQDGKVLIIRNVTSPTGPNARLLVLEREAPTATYPISYGPMATPIMLMPQDEAKLRYSTTDARWNFVEGNRHASVNQMFDEFHEGFLEANGVFYYNTGTGTAVSGGNNGTAVFNQLVMGSNDCGTGTTATGRCYVGSGPGNFFLGAGAALSVIRAWPLQIATGAQNFQGWVGFNNASSAAMPTAACAWVYDPSASTTFYRIANFNASGSTSATTSLAVSNTQPVKFGVFVNGNATAAEYFHSVSDSVTFDGTLNGNMPAGSSTSLGLQSGLTKNTGTTAVFWETDNLGWRYQAPRGR
ncbi:hypothetical protein QWJ07_04035 [Frankia sp. RB7]|nr:hypothetical protein [Frankia sp. RB7]